MPDSWLPLHYASANAKCTHYTVMKPGYVTIYNSLNYIVGRWRLVLYGLVMCVEALGSLNSVCIIT